MAVKNFIQKIAEGIQEPEVHNRFIRFSVGDYPREKILLKQAKKSLQVQTGAEYAYDLILLAAELLKDSDVTLSGEGTITSSNKELGSEIQEAGFAIKAQRGKKYTVTFEFTPDQLVKATQAFKNYILLLKFKTEGVDLKMKLGMPKPGSVVEKFVTLKVDNQYAPIVLKNILFDIEHSTFKKGEIEQTFFIDGVEIPDEYKEDFKLARLHALKVGRIHRKISLDENTLKDYDIDLKA
jgi:hypothetical protein